MGLCAEVLILFMIVNGGYLLVVVEQVPEPSNYLVSGVSRFDQVILPGCLVFISVGFRGSHRIFGLCKWF